MTEIAAFVIVRNEYDNINLCLSSLWRQVDHVLLIDDGTDYKRDETFEIYKYWQNQFPKFTLIDSPHLGFHDLHLDKIKFNTTEPWLFGLDGDEILRTAPEFTLKKLASKLQNSTKYPWTHASCILREYVDNGKELILERSYSKKRLFQRDAGYFSMKLHGEFVIREGLEWIDGHEFGSRSPYQFWIDHIRTQTEKDADAVRYEQRCIENYRASRTEEDKYNYSATYKSMAEFYNWPFKQIEEKIRDLEIKGEL